MIKVHKLKGEEIWINPDLIAFVDDGHQSLITLLDGRHVIVTEKPEEIADSIRTHRAKILSIAFALDERPYDESPDSYPLTESESRHLHPVPTPES